MYMCIIFCEQHAFVIICACIYFEDKKSPYVSINVGTFLAAELAIQVYSFPVLASTVRFSLQVPESHLNAMRRMDPGAFASQPRSCECASCGRNFDSRTPGGGTCGVIVWFQYVSIINP